MKDSVIVVTDGSANNTTGEGGWAAVIRREFSLVEIAGYEPSTTSNRMELTAAIEALRTLKYPTKVDLQSDSAYMLNALENKWYEEWFASAKSRPNLDLWYQLVGEIHFHYVTLTKVKGHSGDYWNERVDRLAAKARISKISVNHTLPNFYDLKGFDGDTDSQPHSVLST